MSKSMTTLSAIAMLIGLIGSAPPIQPAAYTELLPRDSVLLAGEFNRIDRSHWARGTARVLRTETGSLVVAFSDEFESAPGPDLRLVISRNAAPERGRDLGEYTELATLTRTKGAQRFAIPAGTDVRSIASIVIYCKRFDVVFSVAVLRTLTG